MKKVKKASCNNQGIKRYLSPQPSSIPCKKQCKQIDIANGCTTRKDDICGFSLPSKKQLDEMDQKTSNLQLGAGKSQHLNVNNNALNKFDWNSLVRDPGVMQESRYPVTLNTFKTMTHCLGIVNCILKDIKNATSLDFINDEVMKERVLKNFYIQFYENPQIRNMYKLETKACPTFVKKKIMQIPTLENIEAKDNTPNAPKVATTNITHTKAVSKTAKLKVPVEQSLLTADHLEPVSKPTELERVEAQSSKSQENEIPPLQANAKSQGHANIIYISKNISYMDEAFLRRHISRNIQQVEKQQIILERIKAELLQRSKKKYAQSNEVKPKHTPVHEISDEVLIDLSKSPEVSPAIISAEQRVEQAKNLFHKEYTKTNTLAYALRFHNGLNRRIISAILKMSIDEFKKYTKIHNAPELYNDPKLLSDCYNYAIKEPKLWPANLYMPLSDLFAYLKSKGVTLSVDNFEDISPMLLHWTELAVITNFDKIMQWDFYRCKGENFREFTQLDTYRKMFYDKCWMHNTWLREVPTLHIEVQKQLSTGIEVAENESNINEKANKNSNLERKRNETASENCTLNTVKLEAVHETPTNLIIADATEHTVVTNDEPTNLVNVDCAVDIGEVNANNTISVDSNAANAEQSQDTSAGQLAVANEELASHNLTETAVKEERNALPEEFVNSQTTTTAVVEIITNTPENIVINNREIDAQHIQAAKKLYFYEVEKSCSLAYLLRLHNGLKRHILQAILNMTFTEFKQYTHIHDAAEIYQNNELLQHCYDFVVKRPQVWPVNLYMRLVDLYKFLKTKGVTLTAADLTHVSPKLLHWHDLVVTTNYDYILFWDYYRCSGKKMPKNETPSNLYRQKFYEKCWFHDSWIWHTPKIYANVLSDDIVAPSVSVAEAEDKENVNFERSVMTHALEERVEESVSITGGATIEEESDTTNEPPILEANTIENLVLPTNNTRSVSTVDTEIQTSQHLLTGYITSLTVMREPVVIAQNPNSIILHCKAIKEEKHSQLDKLQFNLTNDEENYECVPIADDIVNLEDSIPTRESQEELLLPLSNSENLAPQGLNLLLSFDSTEGKNSQHTAPLTENVESESIMEQKPSHQELNNEQTQLLPECTVEMDIELHSTEDPYMENTTKQTLTDQVSERDPTFVEQPQIETHSAPQPKTCPLPEQQKQVNMGIQEVLPSECAAVAPFPAYISLEVEQELLQQVQQPVDNCTEQPKQKQQTSQQLKTSHIEVATAVTRIIEAHKLAQQQKQQHNRTNKALVTVETKQQQNQTFEQPSTCEKQQPKSAIERQPVQQQQQQLTTVIIPMSTPQQHREKQQPETETQATVTVEIPPIRKMQKLPVVQQKQQISNEQQSAIKQQNHPPTVIIPLPAQQQQQQQQQKEIVIVNQTAQKQRVPVKQQTTQQKQQITKNQKTRRKSQITEKEKATHSNKQLEPQRLALTQQNTSQQQATQTYLQQHLQQQQQQQKELLQDRQLVPQIVAQAAHAQTQPESQQSSQQLTQAALPIHLVQQQLTAVNKSENKLNENPQQLIETIKQNSTLQQQTIKEKFSASKQTRIEFMSQRLLTQSAAQQQHFNQPQPLQCTSSQIQEQLIIRPTGALSQDAPVNVPPFVKIFNKQTKTTTKMNTVKSTKATTRKAAKNSDYVPQLTHVFQPLPVALNTKKTSTQSTTTNGLLQSTTNIATSSNLQLHRLTPALEEPIIASNNITLPSANANTMILTLPAPMNAASNNAPNSSYGYSLSGDSTFFNSSELLKAIENYQLQRSQQQIIQLEQMSQQQSCAQTAELVFAQPQMAQMPRLQQQQCAQMQQEQQFELYNQLQVTQQQQQHYQAALQMPQPLTLLESEAQQHQQQQQQQQSYQLLLQEQQTQPVVFQLVDANQALHIDGEQIQQYLQLSEEQTQTPNFPQHEVQEASTTHAQQHATLDTEHSPYTNTNEMLQVNVWLEHNYAMTPLSPRVLTPLPSPKGVCRMRSRPVPKPFFYRRLEKLDYFRELTALNIGEYQLQCTSLGKPYLQAKIRTTHLRTVVSGDILSALFPRYAPDLLKHLQLVLQFLGEFHYNTWEQRQQRKLISKCSHRTLNTLCAHILLLFFQYSSPFQSKCLDLAEEMQRFLEQRDCLSVATASASTLRTDDMFDDLSLAIDPCILSEMAELKRKL